MKIKRSRLLLGMSQRDLAKLTGLQVSAISHFEHGRRVPSLKNLIKLANALNVSLDYMVDRNDDNNPFSFSQEDQNLLTMIIRRLQRRRNYDSNKPR